MSKANKLIVVIIVLLAVGLGIYGYVQTNLKTEQNDLPLAVVENLENENIEITVQPKLNVFYNIADITVDNVLFEFEEGTSVLQALIELSEDEVPIIVGVESYEGLGDLVVQIGDFKNGDDNKYWQYTVNEEVPMVGADQYILQNGDSVEWEFMESEF